MEQRQTKEKERQSSNKDKAVKIKAFIEQNYEEIARSQSRTINEFYVNEKNADPVLMSDEYSDDSDMDST